MKNTIKHDYKCEKCGKPATRNIQNWWHEYKIDEKGDMTEINDWSGDNNIFLCDECEE